MAMIYVKARPGRSIPYEGRKIPEDKFIPVADIPYIRRIIAHWDDLEVQQQEAKPKDSEPTPSSAQYTS
jgi:hypothetical protein